PPGPSGHDQLGNRRQHLRRLERLDHPGLGTGGLAGGLLGSIGFGGEHDHRGELVGRQLLGRGDEGDAVHVGHVHVADDQ
ncbi:hypothetical protein COLO4_02381, partial [Corchorus olitorius]